MSKGAESHGFLGEGFLTWLWFRHETESGEFVLPSGRVVAVMLDDLLTFAAPRDDETEQILRHGAPTRTAEARTALRGGRRLKRARLLVAEGSHQWSATVDGTTLSLSGVKLPDDSEDVSSDPERNEERAGSWLQLHEIVTALYREFLRVRLRPDYLQTVGEDQANWMAASKKAGAAPLTAAAAAPCPMTPATWCGRRSTCG